MKVHLVLFNTFGDMLRTCKNNNENKKTIKAAKLLMKSLWSLCSSSSLIESDVYMQNQSPESIAYRPYYKCSHYKASTSTNNVLGSCGAYSHKIYQKLSLHKIAHLNNDHILQMTTSVYKLYKNLLTMPPISYSGTCILKMHC